MNYEEVDDLGQLPPNPSLLSEGDSCPQSESIVTAAQIHHPNQSVHLEEVIIYII